LPTIRANNINIYVETFGPPDGVPILIVRGLGTQIIHWPLPFIERLVEHGFWVIAPDNRDAGLSQHLDELGAIDVANLQHQVESGQPIVAPYTVTDFADDHVAVLDHFDARHAHILGISMGGMIVQTMAYRYPDRVSTMTSVMSSSGNPEISLGSRELRELMLETPENPDDRDEVVAFTLRCDRLWGSPGYPFEDAVRAELIGRAYDRAWTPAGVARQYAAVRASGSRAEMLRNIELPSLVIHGLDDPLLQPEHGRDTAHHLPNAELIEIAGMGHDMEGALGPMIADHVAKHVYQHVTK
jgi:pimeloyl-ACP methyl ester carboxylesterase